MTPTATPGAPMTEGGGDPPWAYAAALAGLPYMAWDRLAALLAGRTPAEAWRAVRSGQSGLGLAQASSSVDVGAVAEAHERLGVTVHLLGQPGYPAALAEDEEAAPVLFTMGADPMAPASRAALVGTRRCTRYGRDVARQLGRELAAAGVAVVSGLALGIDGAAHEGALAAGPAAAAAPIAVVGSGLDVVYPRRHAGLWNEVAARGTLISEGPLGARPEPWRFPARNRLLAALADVVVVVESHVAGGSMHTVRAAEARGVPVMAVPGPVRSPASVGSNRLIADGCAPACDVTDVLVALSLETAGASSASRLAVETRRPPRPGDGAMLEALDWQPRSLDDLLARTGVTPGTAAGALARLEMDGWVVGRGGWWERVAGS